MMCLFYAVMLVSVLAIFLAAYSTSDSYNGKVLKNFFDNFKRVQRHRAWVKTMVLGLRSQEWRRSSNCEGNCMYRTKTENGRTLRCIFGALIPDSLYAGKMEHTSAFDVLTMSPELVTLLGVTDMRWESRSIEGSDMNLFLDLQSAHDRNSPASMQERVRNTLESKRLFFRFELNRMFA